MAESLDLDAMIARFKERAKAVRNRPLPPVAGDERTKFIEQAQRDYQDFAIIGDAEATVEDGVVVLRIDLRPKGAVSSERFRAAIAAIDAANAGDPNVLVVAGVARPKEQAHAEMMTSWLERLDPDADHAQHLAARAHHLRRWSVPRSEYAEGRAGYLKWRTALKKQHADEVGAILGAVGYGPEVIDRVGAIIRKQGLGSDPAVQTHEDALCLTFLETQFDALIERLGEEKAIDVVRKTLGKMSGAGVAAASGLPFSAAAARVVAAASTPE